MKMNEILNRLSFMKQPGRVMTGKDIEALTEAEALIQRYVPKVAVNGICPCCGQRRMESQFCPFCGQALEVEEDVLG